MRHFIIFFFLFTTSTVFAQIAVSIKWLPTFSSANNDTLSYNRNKKLVWPDFNGKPDRNSDATAITSSGFGYQAGMQYRDGMTDILITVYCYFSRLNSWVKKGGESDYALNHEQHHFDVTYITAFLFFQKLKAAKFTRNNYNTLLEKLYSESSRDLEKMQNDYDGQTRNGRLKNIQSNWNETIEKQLDLLSKD